MKVAQTNQIVHRLFQRIRGGTLDVTYWDGTRESYGEGEPRYGIRFREDFSPDFSSGDWLTALGEAYMDGQLEVEGDLGGLVSLVTSENFLPDEEAHPFLTPLLRATAAIRSITRQKEDISRHYDLGNDFFRLWLDESMTYSCAYFRTRYDTLEQAQRQKIEHSLRKLRIAPGERLLDIGCGWGSLVMHAAAELGVEAVGITLSEEQHALAGATIRARGLDDKASVRLIDYGSLSAEGRKFHKVVSIGMIEHVGKAHLGEFFAALEKLLKPGGLALLHMITGMKENRGSGWIEKYIFPGGYIPMLPEIVAQASSRGLRVWDVENLGPHYHLTLEHWVKRFEQAAAKVRKMFDERFVRMWRLFLLTSSAAFREGRIEVHQILVSHGKPRALPPTRDDLYALQGTAR